jgi:hypothetical protein
VNDSTLLGHLVVLLVALPLQLGLAAINSRTAFFTPGELRFWGVALFLIVEIAYLVWL